MPDSAPKAMAPVVLDSWTIYGRSAAKRDVVVYDDGTAEITIHDALYYTVNGTREDPISIDPDGGPRFGIGTRLKKWAIEKIVEYHHTERVDSDSDWDEEMKMVIDKVIVIAKIDLCKRPK
jgi:hypothetical protein